MATKQPARTRATKAADQAATSQPTKPARKRAPRSAGKQGQQQQPTEQAADQQPTKADQPTEQPAGRVVANKARPTRLSWLSQFEQAAVAAGWQVSTVSTADAVAAGGAYLSADQVEAGGAIATRGAAKLVTTSFLTRDGSSNRMDAAYLWASPTQGQGKRVATMYQVLATLAQPDQADQPLTVAPRDAAKQRGTSQAEQADTGPAKQPQSALAKLTKANLVAYATEQGMADAAKQNKASLLASLVAANLVAAEQAA